MSDSTFSKIAKQVVLYIGFIISIILGNVIYEQFKATLNELHKATVEIDTLKQKVAVLEKPSRLPSFGVTTVQELPIPESVHSPRISTFDLKPPSEANKIKPIVEMNPKQSAPIDNIPENGSFTLLNDEKKGIKMFSVPQENTFKLLQSK